MQQNVRQLRLHEVVRILSSIVVGVDTSPRGTYNQSIGFKRFDLKEVLIDELQAMKAFVVDLHVMLEHLEFVWIDIVDNVLFEVIA